MKDAMIVNDIPIVGTFAVVTDSDDGMRIICSDTDEYSPDIAFREVVSVFASGDELVVVVK